MKCERCYKKTFSTTMNYFNAKMICPDCEDREKKDPRYEKAKARELEEVKKGNYIFKLKERR